MARPKDPGLERAWRQRLHRHAASGLSIIAFCAREGVSTASFHAWKRRLASRSLSPRPEPPLFVPLQLPAHTTEDDQGPSRGVELELPHRVRLRLEGLPEPQWLGRVVAALAGLPHPEATP